MNKDAIRRLVATHAKLQADVADLGDEGDLYEAGLTSLNTVNLMLAIEDQFDIEFDDSSLTRETFKSIDALSRVVANLVAAAA